MSKQVRINLSRIAFFGLFVLLMVKGKPMVWLGIFGVSLLAAFLFGRFYCGWICPMNSAMVVTETAAKKMKLKQRNSPKWLESGWLSWVLLVVMGLSMAMLRKLLGVQIPVLFYFLILSVLVTIFYKPEVFHNKICPFGGLLSLTGRFARFSRKVNTEQCIGCKRCETTCPSTAVKVSREDRKARIDSKLCHQCFNCEIICPEDAIAYQKK